MLLELARRYGDIIQAIEVQRFRIAGASYELRAVMTLKDGAKLFVKDYLFLDGTRKYAYHWQNREGQLQCRWDNAPHWLEVTSYPHHQHLGSAKPPGPPGFQAWGGLGGGKALPQQQALLCFQRADITIGMEQARTIVCKIQPSTAERSHIDDTLRVFAEACAYIHAQLPERITNVMRMQAMLYYDVRQRFGLSSNLAQQAFRRVAANRKAAQSQGTAVKAFHTTSIQYDQRIFSFRERDWTVSLTLLRGRVRFALHVGNYQRGKLTGQQPTSAQLCQHRDGSYAVHIQVKAPVPPLHTPTDVLGVDLGRTDIAHTSDGDAWDGADMRQCRDHFARMRAMLSHKASKGTRSTRRRCRQLLARLSGRERRFQRHTNHVISKTLVRTAQSQQAALALEDLTGIRERTNTQPRTKTERRRGNSWAFYQLRQFVAYKAQGAGVVLHLVPAAYTSQMCHGCLHIGSRKTKRFACDNLACGWTGDADFNAAKNIRILGQQVSLARGPWLHCQLQGS